VDDGLAAGGGPLEACGVGDVALGKVATPARELPGARWIADEATNRAVGRTEGVNDLGPDEARPAGDEDQRVTSWRKFCQ
jgi:hypothetical protein